MDSIIRHKDQNSLTHSKEPSCFDVFICLSSDEVTNPNLHLVKKQTLDTITCSAFCLLTFPGIVIVCNFLELTLEGSWSFHYETGRCRYKNVKS